MKKKTFVTPKITIQIIDVKDCVAASDIVSENQLIEWDVLAL